MQRKNRMSKVALGDLFFRNVKSVLQETHLSRLEWLENFSCYGTVRTCSGRIFLEISFESNIDGVMMTMEEFFSILMLRKMYLSPLEFFCWASALISRQDTSTISSNRIFSPHIYSYLRSRIMKVALRVAKVFVGTPNQLDEHPAFLQSTLCCSSQQRFLGSEDLVEEFPYMEGSLVFRSQLLSKGRYRKMSISEVDESTLVQHMVQPVLSIFAGMILEYGIVSSNSRRKKTSEPHSNQKRKRNENGVTPNGKKKAQSTKPLSKAKGQGHQKHKGSSSKAAEFESKKSHESKKSKGNSDKARMKKKKKKAISENESNRNEYDKALGRMKGQMSRFRQEQALIMAYDADGWNGASREKVKPHTEIARARISIAKCLETIRDCIRICDEAGGDKSIPSECFDEEGELDADSIFCGKCLKSDSTDDNDIILCDGVCDRAYHMKCVFPPLDASVLEDTSDEGWLCPACDRKIDMIDEINDEFGTDYDYEESWEKLLLPDSLPKHEHYDFQRGDESGNIKQLSWLDSLELPSEDESDEDFRADNSADSCSQDVNSNSDGESDDSCTSEELTGSIKDVEIHQLEDGTPNKMDKKQLYKFLEDNSPEYVEGKRKRVKVDYNALNQELFGGVESPNMKFPVHVSDSDSDDAVWSPSAKKN